MSGVHSSTLIEEDGVILTVTLWTESGEAADMVTEAVPSIATLMPTSGILLSA